MLVHDVALAIVDVQMPGMDGFELAELMRGTERTRRIPIIFVTAGAVDMQRRFRGYEAGAVDFLFKPIEPRILQSKAEVFFELYLQRREVARQRDQLRVAAILHEDLQQQTAGAKFHLNLLKSRTRDNPSQQAVVARVDEMLKEAIEKSRSLSHDLSPAVLHLNDLAEILGWLAKELREKHGLTVRVDIPCDVTLHSEAMTTFLFRAAQEMLFNVVKHARVNEARIRVRRTRQLVYLSVSDRGHGFDPEELKEMAGLGLLSIRERVELLGGRMRITSTEGKGSRFRIVVSDPQEVTAPPASQGRVTQPKAAGPHSNGRLRVPLADDHEIVRQGLVSLLRETPEVEVVGEASNGRDAVDLAFQLRPDVVAMDVAMPVMSGEEATRQIKKYLPATRIVALSMHQEAETIERMCQAGAAAYFLKTASSDELLAAIRGNGSA